MTIIANNTTKEEDNEPKFTEINVGTFGFKLFNFGCSCFIAHRFAKQNEKVSIANIFDIPILFNLIFRAVEDLKDKVPDTGATFSINTSEIAQNIFRGDKSNPSARRKRLFTIFNAVNKLTAFNRQLLSFSAHKKQYLMTVFPAFYMFAEKYIKRANQGCIKILPQCNFELNKLRNSERGYVLFIEKLYSIFVSEDKELKATDYKDYLKTEEGKKSKLRLLILFKKGVTYHFSLNKVITDGLAALDRFGIDDRKLLYFANELRTKKNSSGISPEEKLSFFDSSKQKIESMVDNDAELTEVLETIGTFDKERLTDKQLRALRVHCINYFKTKFKVA